MNVVNILDILITLLFPAEPETNFLESLTPETFSIKAKKCVDDSVTSIFSYRDKLVRKAIWELKYRGNRKIARLFAIILYDFILETLSEDALFNNFNSPLLIPIPLSKERLKERGWNQTEMLARELEKLDRNNFFRLGTDVLIKKNHTVSQTSLSKSERLKNLKNCFEIAGKSEEEIQNNRKKIKNRNIILIDDVTTTGATLSEASKALKQAGAREIRTFTIAH
jgi:competence protein ComFC